MWWVWQSAQDAMVLVQRQKGGRSSIGCTAGEGKSNKQNSPNLHCRRVYFWCGRRYKGEEAAHLVMVLATRFEFGTRASIWSRTQSSRFVPAPNFGRTGMSRTHSDKLWRYLVWSSQPAVCPPGMLSERYRWMLCDDFVHRFNEHQINYFIPSDHICVDKSISCWYDMGSHWINMGLPMYIVIDRKP